MLRGILACVWFAAATPVLGLAALVHTLWRPGSDAVIHLGRIWSRGFLRLIGVRARYHGTDLIPRDGPCVFLCNHASVVDIFVLLNIVPPATRFVAKSELFRIPILGHALAASGFVAVDRSNRASAISSLRAAARAVAEGRPMLLFPEGTRSRDGQLRPFKKGAFHLALDAGVPVVPVSIVGSFERVRPASVRAVPGPVDIVFDAPIDVGPYRPGDVAGLSERVRAAIERRLAGPAGSARCRDVADSV